MKIVLASRNQKKIRELHTLLSEAIPGIEILSLDDVGITGEIEENGNSFEENAFLKAEAAAKSGYIGVGDDSGLTVDYLHGEPGIFSARYAKMNGFSKENNDDANNELVLQRLANVPMEKRDAAFVCVIACVFPNGKRFCSKGEVRGKILTDYRGEKGFGYDPLFYYEPFGKTLAEVTAEEKNEVSHRGKAIRLFAEQLKKEL